MKTLKKLTKKNGGFTLVEVIVVLVILAILAAILIPSLTGYIDRANNRAIIAEARAVAMAAQTLASEDYALTSGDTVDVTEADVLTLAEVGGTLTGEIKITNGKVTDFTYNNFGKTCVYNGTATASADKFAVSKTAAAPAGG